MAGTKRLPRVGRVSPKRRVKIAGVVVALVLLVLVPGFFLCLWAFSGGRSGTVEPVKISSDQTPEPADAKPIPEGARKAYEALKKLQAKTEVGINKVNYGRELGEVWYVVKKFLDSEDAKGHPRLSRELAHAMECFKLANGAWKDMIQLRDSSRGKRAAEELLKGYWRFASDDLSRAERLMKND